MHLIVSSLFFYYSLFCFVLVFFIIKAIFFNLVRGINLPVYCDRVKSVYCVLVSKSHALNTTRKRDRWLFI